MKDEQKCEYCAGCSEWKCDCANIKSEAYKEFAERLNKNFETYTDDEEKNAKNSIPHKRRSRGEVEGG